MSKFFTLSIIALSFCATATAQNQSRFSVTASYGLNGNFFVNSFDEESGPQPHEYFYNKKFLGTISGLGISYALNEKTFLNLEYNRSINKGKKNFGANIDGVDFFIDNFKLSYINNFFQLGYGRLFKAGKSKLSGELGIVYVTTNNQSITIDGGTVDGAVIDIRETSLKRSGSEEGGFFAGFGWQCALNDRFTAGLRARAYFLVSIGYTEAITLTPTLSYRF